MVCLDVLALRRMTKSPEEIGEELAKLRQALKVEREGQGREVFLMAILEEIKGLEAQRNVLGQSAGDLIPSTPYILICWAPLQQLGRSAVLLLHHSLCITTAMAFPNLAIRAVWPQPCFWLW